MAPSAKVTLKMSHDNDAEQEEKSDWVSIKRFASNATTRNMLDLLLVTTIIVLLGIAAPVIRGDCKGKFLLSMLLVRLMSYKSAFTGRSWSVETSL